MCFDRAGSGVQLQPHGMLRFAGRSEQYRGLRVATNYKRVTVTITQTVIGNVSVDSLITNY
jgi:hypothetical protein